MARRAEPRVIDFTHCDEYRYGFRLRFNALTDHTETTKGPTSFTIDTDGKLHAHTKPVPEFRMKRARRILWECQQHPDWPHKPSMFFRHPSLKNVPYPVLKRLVKESEARDG